MSTLSTAKFQTWGERLELVEIQEQMAELRAEISKCTPFSKEYSAKVKQHNKLGKRARYLS